MQAWFARCRLHVGVLAKEGLARLARVAVDDVCLYFSKQADVKGCMCYLLHALMFTLVASGGIIHAHAKETTWWLRFARSSCLACTHAFSSAHSGVVQQPGRGGSG